MPELLIELFSEEIPARMQARAAEDLRRLVTEGLKAAGLPTGEARSYATPRRLTLVIEQVRLERLVVREDHRPLHRVLQLTNVARPGMNRKAGQELGRAVFALGQIDRDDLAFEPQLEQCETDLLRIG